jgi:hypothetical protein
VIQTEAAESLSSGLPSGLRKPNIEPGALFARWFWLVYVPLVSFAGLLGFAFGGLLPRWGFAALVVTALWAAAAMRLLAERIRLGVEVPLPKNLVGGITWIVGLGTTGAVFVWIGLSKLTSESGMILALAGLFFIAFATLLPLMKVVDTIGRKSARLIARLIARAFVRPLRATEMRPAPQRPAVRRRVPQQPVPRPAAQRPAAQRPAAQRPAARPRRQNDVEREEIRVTSAASRG